MTVADPRPLIVHVVYRFAVGGLENGIVNLINRMDHDRWRHAVFTLDTASDEMRVRVRRGDVRYVELGKPPGQLLPHFPRIVRLFRGLAPAVVHTRNLGALEASVPAWLAGVPIRVHGEHGWDVNDIEGCNRTYQWVRRMYRPFVHRYAALSQQIAGYLQDAVRVPAERISTICNGVDTERFRPRSGARQLRGLPAGFESAWLVGTVGRLQAVKDQALLIRAFAAARRADSMAGERMRLVIVGDGPLRGELEATAAACGVADAVWFAGERADVPEVLRTLDLFCLPSLSEGISNTILEAMACAVPVVATRVGGNAELVDEGITGRLIEARDEHALAACLMAYQRSGSLGERHGAAGRLRVEQHFSLDAMVRAYEDLYMSQLVRRGLGGMRLRQA